MDFTREPIIQTVITPKEGCTLAVRSSKGTGQEEYFVDAVEVVSFGSALFFRSLERPKSFLLPVSDYEILEVRETRLVLKNVGLDRSIKIGGGREASLRTAGRPPQEKPEVALPPAENVPQVQPAKEQPESLEPRADVKLDKKRDRRRNYKRKKGRDDQQDEDSPKDESENGKDDTTASQPALESGVKKSSDVGVVLPPVFSSLLPPPSTLISETIARYKDNALFRGAFFIKDQDGTQQDTTESVGEPAEKPQLEVPHDEDEGVELPSISLDLPTYTPPEMSEEEEERVYQERQALRLGRRGSSNSYDSSNAEDVNEHHEEHHEKRHEEHHEVHLAEESPEETVMPEEVMMETEAEGFADNLDVDLREDQSENPPEDASEGPTVEISPEASEDFSSEKRNSP